MAENDKQFFCCDLDRVLFLFQRQLGCVQKALIKRRYALGGGERASGDTGPRFPPLGCDKSDEISADSLVMGALERSFMLMVSHLTNQSSVTKSWSVRWSYDPIDGASNIVFRFCD